MWYPGGANTKEKCYDRRKVRWMSRVTWKNEMTMGLFGAARSMKTLRAAAVSMVSPALTPRESPRVLTPNRHHHTCPGVKMELVCVGTVEGVGDLAISSHVWIGSWNLQHKPAWGWVFHHCLRVHQLEQEDNNSNKASICLALFFAAKCWIHNTANGPNEKKRF